LLPILRQEEAKKVLLNQNICSSISVQTDDTYMSPRRNLKTTEDGTRKGTEQSGYQFKKYRTPACKNCPVNHLCTSRTAGREIDRSEYADAVEENNKRYQENPQLCTRQRLTNIYLAL
jgi:hypothetical protein